MKITIGEIARQAGVSTGTVSRVINGKPTVAADTRAAGFTAAIIEGAGGPVTPVILRGAGSAVLGSYRLRRDAIRHNIVPVKTVEGATLGPAPRKG